ncbi:uncharacterized protein METZ01_LOCUS192713 [marine metagenome]|uniref:Lipoprotein n=1 Tax=marine metagenome TaxID=408172 RepID=A0A382DNS3_9ZZZZ
MMKTSKYGLYGCLAILVGGCVSANFLPTGGRLYAPRPPGCAIEVFSSGSPDRAYEEIGMVEGKGTAWKAELRDVLPAIMEEGCRAGGDGIIIGSVEMFEEGRENTPAQLIQATVIRWTN